MVNSKLILTLGLVLSLAGCLDTSDGSTYDDTGIDSSGSGSTTPSTYDYTFTCEYYGGTYTIEIPRVGCDSEYEYYGKTFSCNQIDNMNTAACNLEACTGEAIFGCGFY